MNGSALTMLSVPTTKPRYPSLLPNEPAIIAKETKITPTPMKADATSGLFAALTANVLDRELVAEGQLA